MLTNRPLGHRSLVSVLLVGAAASTALLSGCSENADPYWTDGNNAMITHDYEKARQDYTKYLEILPGQPKVQDALGQAYMGLNKPFDAAAQFQVAHYTEPTKPEYLDHLCDALLAADRRDDLSRLLRSYASDSSAPGAVANFIRLGKYSAKMGDADSAQTALLTAARIDRGQTLAPQLALYDFYALMGRANEADQRLRMAYYIAPRDPDVQSRLAKSGAVVGPTYRVQPPEQNLP